MRARVAELEQELASSAVEKARAEEQIRQLSEELRTLLDAMPAYVWIAEDSQCRRIVGNRAANELTGTPTGTNISQSAAETERIALSQFKEDGTEYSTDELPMQRAVAQGHAIRDTIIDFRLSGGKRVQVVGNAVPLFDACNEVRGCVAAFVNISRRRETEEALRSSYELLNLLVDTSPLAVIEWDSEFRIMRWAGAAEQIFGWTVGEVLGKRIYELPWIYEEDVPLIDRTMADMISGKRASNVIINRNRRKDGSVIYCDWYNSSIHDSNGRLVSVLSQALDVTDQKRAEDALRDSEEKFRTLADSIPQLAWMAEGNGSIFWYNQRWYDYTGTTFDEMEGWGWQKVHHADHLQRVVEHFRHCSETGETWEDTFPLLGKDGQYRWFLSRAVPTCDSDGRITRWFGTNTDITALREAEHGLRASQEKFRRLYEANLIGIVSVDSEKIYDANDIFLEMIGSTRADLESGRLRWRDRTPPEYLHLYERGIEELLTTGSSKPFEKELFRNDGSRIPILIGATVLERSPLKWLCFILDLTERKALERKLVETQKLESVGLLAGGIAHDFNNLLVGILGNASLGLDMVPAGSPVSRVLNNIVMASERAAHLTRQMLAYSGKGRFVIEPVDLSNLVDDMTRLLEPALPKNVEFHYDLDRNIPAVEGDAGQIQQVVTNLVLNAAEAVGGKTGSVTLRTGTREVDSRYIREALEGAEIEPGSYVFFEVRDTGCGMDEVTKSRIFDPFFTTKFTGRGLGLAAVAGILRGHKGTIRVTSTPGRGSTFIVLLPVTRALLAMRATHPAATERSAPGTILVVDDEDLVLRTARIVLERQGHAVLEASSGPRAVDVLRREKDRISAVLLDLSMPGMSGHEALRELRRIKPEIPVIVSSGYSEVETMRLFSGQPVSGFVQKPYTSTRLAEKISAVLQQG